MLTPRLCRTARRFAVDLALAATLPPAASAQCIHYDDYLHWLGMWHSGTSSGRVEYSAPYAYVTGSEIGWSGVSIVDASNRTGPVTAGSLTLARPASDIAVQDSRLYIATGESLQVVDVSDPAAPVVIGGVALPAQATALAVEGALGYLAVDTLGIYVIDLSDPASPGIIGSAGTGRRAYGLAVSGGYVYAACLTSTVAAVDVSQPASPRLVDLVEVPGVIRHAEVSGSRLYVAGWGLHVLDLSTPASPALIGSLDNLWIGDLAVVGSRAYATRGVLSVFDISDPSRITSIGHMTTFGDVGGVAAVDSTAFFVEHGDWSARLHVLDVSNPASPGRIGRVRTGGFAGRVATAGRYTYVLDDGLKVVDTSDPSAPVVVAHLPIEAYDRDLALEGSFIYTGTSAGGVEVVDIATSEAPEIVGRLNTRGDIRGIAASGGRVYAADYPSELRVIDVTNPAAPALLGSVQTPGGAWDVVVRGNLAFVADGYNGLTVVSVFNPSAPVVLGSGSTLGTAHSVAASGGLVYVADWGAVYVFDVSDPAHPIDRGWVVMPDEVEWIASDGSTVYAPCRSAGLQMVDASDPFSPKMLGSFPLATDAYASDCAVSGGRLYIAVGGAGLVIAPAHCTPVAVELAHSEAEEKGPLCEVRWGVYSEIDHVGYNLYRLDGASRALVARGIREPVSRGAVIEYRYVDGPVRSAGERRYLLEAVARDGSVQTFGPITAKRGAAPAPPFLSAAAPNPFSSVTTFSVRAEGPVTFRIFDVAGRLVRELVRGEPAETVVWDGTDEAGRAVGAGIYEARLDAGGTIRVERVVRIR